MTTKRPRIAILGRLAERTSVTRFRAVALPRRLLELVWDAGGDPVMLLPVADCDWSERLVDIDGILMPGGSDLNPERYGEQIATEEIYGVDDLQDEADISLIRYAFEAGVPMLTICRGTQVANVVRGGTLLQHMATPHRHVVLPVTFEIDQVELGVGANPVQASCYHHQIIKKIGSGVIPIAHSVEGHIEAVKYEAKAWAYGVQWHPEDNYDEDGAQLEIVRKFIEATR